MSTINQKLIISVFTLFSLVTAPVYAGNCDNALNACIEYTEALEAEKSAIERYADEVRKQRDASYEREIAAIRDRPLLPWWAYAGLGALAGIAVGAALAK